jgi:ketosteroid isomerase-like protein
MSDALIRGMFRAIDARDWAAMGQYFTADVVYERPGYEPIRGFDALMQFYCEVRIIVSGSHELQRIVADPAAASCWGRFRGEARDGRKLDERFADVYTLRDGRVATRITHFFRAAI